MFDLYDDFFQLWKLWACRIARDWEAFIDLESEFWGKAVVEISFKPQNCQNDLH